MKKINIQNEANINAEGKLTNGNCKPVICIDTGDVFTSCYDAAESIGVHYTAMSAHLRGKTRTIHGKRYIYLSRVSEGLDVIATRLRETSAMEDDAKKWREYKAQQDAIRQEEERRAAEARKAEEKRRAELEKAQAKVAKLTESCQKLQAQWHEKMAELVEAEKALELLTNNENNEEAAA